MIIPESCRIVTIPIRARKIITRENALNKSEPVGDVSWNFEKFLVGKDGNVIARFQPGIQPSDEELVAAIEVALAS